MRLGAPQSFLATPWNPLIQIDIVRQTLDLVIERLTRGVNRAVVGVYRLD